MKQVLVPIIAMLVATPVGIKLGQFAADHNFGIALPIVVSAGLYFLIIRLLK